MLIVVDNPLTGEHFIFRHKMLPRVYFLIHIDCNSICTHKSQTTTCLSHEECNMLFLISHGSCSLECIDLVFCQGVGFFQMVLYTLPVVVVDHRHSHFERSLSRIYSMIDCTIISSYNLCSIYILYVMIHFLSLIKMCTAGKVEGFIKQDRTNCIIGVVYQIIRQEQVDQIQGKINPITQLLTFLPLSGDLLLLHELETIRRLTIRSKGD